MTEKAHPSVNRPAEAFKTAGGIALAGGTGDGYVADGATPTELAQQDNGITQSELNTFEAEYGKTFDVSGQDTGPTAVEFNDTGSKVFVVGTQNASIYEYALSTNYDISTASFTDSLDVSGEDATPNGLAFNGDGTVMAFSGAANANVYEYSLSAGFDVSTASLTSTTDVSAQDTSPRDVSYNDTGSKLYVLGDGTEAIYEYALGTNYDVSTATLNDSLDISGNSSSARGFAWRPDGTTLYIADSGVTDINEYDVGTSYDVSTATFTDALDVSGQDGTPTGITHYDSGASFVISGDGTDALYRYALEVDYDISTGDYSGVVVDPGEAFVYGSWVAIDTRTTVSLASNTADQTVYVGWNKGGTDDVIIGLDSAFANASGDTDMKLPLYDFDTDTDHVTAVSDNRTVGQTVSALYETNTITGNYTTSGEQFILVDSSTGSHTVTLSSADTQQGKEVVVVDVGGNAQPNTITIDTEGSETINGGSSTTIESDYGASRLVSNGDNWFSAGGGSGGGASISENGSVVVSQPSDVDYRQGIQALDDGDGTASVVFLNTRDPRM